MLPPSAKLCCHPVRRNTATFRRSPKCVQISSAPKACGGVAAVRSGRGRSLALGSKVRLADQRPLSRKLPVQCSLSDSPCWRQLTIRAAEIPVQWPSFRYLSEYDPKIDSATGRPCIPKDVVIGTRVAARKQRRGTSPTPHSLQLFIRESRSVYSQCDCTHRSCHWTR
jgi:hypothetical protein